MRHSAQVRPGHGHTPPPTDDGGGEPSGGYAVDTLSPTGGVVGGRAAVMLSPELMLAFLRSNLEDIDHQVSDILHGLDRRRDEMQVLSDQIQGLRDLEGKLRDDGDKRAAARGARDLLHDAQVDRYTNDHGELSKSDLEALRENLQRQLEDLGNATEYDTMVVQSLMGKRSNMIELTSNILRSLDDGATAVIKNI